MRVAFGLRAADLYADRARMIGHLSDHVESMVLLTDAIQPEFKATLESQHPRLKIQELGPKSVQTAFEWLIRHRGALEVIHDTMGLFAPYFQKFGPVEGRRERLIATLYTNNWGWFERVRRPDMDFSFRYLALRAWTLWNDRRVCRGADRVLVLGPGHERDLVDAHGIPERKIHWVPSETDVDKFVPRRDEVDGPPVILFVGAICRSKGVDTLLKAARRLSDQGHEFELRLVGRLLLWETDWFEKAVRDARLGHRLSITGELGFEALMQEYLGAHVLAFPSHFEGSPRAVREALACGTPAVVSEIAGHRGIDPDGDFLRFVPDFEPDSWNEALSGALNEADAQWRARSQRGIDHLRQHHSLRAVAKRLYTVYQGL